MMQIVEDVRRLNGDGPETVLTIGSFDGLHRGHQRILEEVVRCAKASGREPAVLTLHPHPREYFHPHAAPNLLMPFPKKAALIKSLGMAWLFVLPFDEKTANLSREQFLADILHSRCRAKHLIVGHDFRFGKGAAGDIAYLYRAAPQFDMEVSETPPVTLDGERVSSTLIRERVLAGDLDAVTSLLGRPYAVIGTIVPGRGRGAKLGFPTANIQPLHSAVPAHGVYAATVLIEGHSHPAAVNIGIAPTFPHDEPVIEAHLIGFHGDVTGLEAEIVFHKRLRGERKFPSAEALIRQIALDVAAVSQLLGRNKA